MTSPDRTRETHDQLAAKLGALGAERNIAEAVAVRLPGWLAAALEMQLPQGKRCKACGSALVLDSIYETCGDLGCIARWVAAGKTGNP